MSDNHTKPNVKARHGANLSLNDTNLSLGNRHGQATKHSLNSKVRLSVVTPVITHFFMKQAIATDDNSGYYIDLSKTQSGQASRDILAFFVPDNSAASQAVPIHSSIAPQAHTCATRGQTIISKVNTSPTDYDGLTLQNKRAERRICGAVTLCTESKTRHPIPLPYSVAHTQKHKGVIYNG
ncbi:hypothetical protein [Psychrobacter pacificensis]|uniref:hypothetical protein n=1 Tax=Psychrobacter pacificensis TaxID=112002 RepID=UPI0028C47A2A|nr:hypothetical protein [Psychrobacter pacificensis]